MCARSQTSGLISSEWAVSTSASDSGSTSASVRSRASSSASAMPADPLADVTAVIVETVSSGRRSVTSTS